MKILMIHHYGGLGGGLTSCIDVAEMLNNLGMDTTVAIPNPSDKVKKLFSKAKIELDETVPDVPVLNYHNACSGVVPALIKYHLSFNKIADWSEYLEKHYFDMVILNSIVQVPLVPMIKKLGIKCLVFIRETIKGDSQKGLNPKLASFMSKADGLVFLTEYDKKSWGISNNIKQYVIPDIVDAKKFTTINEQETKKKNTNVSFLYLGGLSYVKGAKDLLLAFQKLLCQEQNVKLIMLGETYEQYTELGFIRKIIHRKNLKYVKECKRLIELLNSDGEYIKVVGLTSSPGEWYLQSDIVVFPVKKIHQARPVYEAGYYKKTVILPDYQNFEEAVIDKYNGRYYKKNDINSLAEKMKELCENSTLRNRMAENNWVMYKAKHTYEYAVNILKLLINEME